MASLIKLKHQETFAQQSLLLAVSEAFGVADQVKAPGDRLHDCMVANPGKMQGHHKGIHDHQEFVILSSRERLPGMAYVVVLLVVGGDKPRQEQQNKESSSSGSR